jgi:hypothetical protein
MVVVSSVKHVENHATFNQVSGYCRLKEIANSIAYVAKRIFQAVYQCITFPCRYLGSKDWSIPGIIIRTPYLIFKKILGFPVTKETFFGTGYHASFQKQLSKQEAKEHLLYACMAGFGHANNPCWIEPFGYKVISPKELGIKDERLQPKNTCFFDPDSGLKIALAEKEGEVLISFGAIDSGRIEVPEKEIKNLNRRLHIAAGANLWGFQPGIFAQAEEFIKKLKEMPQFKDKKILLVGQCLGGALAQYVALKQQLKSYCFNTLPIGAGLQWDIPAATLQKAEEYVTHVGVKGDFAIDGSIPNVFDFIFRKIGIKTSGNFGKKYFIPSAYQDRKLTHERVIGSLMKYLGFHENAKPQDINLSQAISAQSTGTQENTSTVGSSTIQDTKEVALKILQKTKVLPDDKKLLHAVKTLEEGMDISESTIKKVQMLMPKILSSRSSSEFEVLPSGENNIVFKLKDAPQWIFKLAQGFTANIHNRFLNMIEAQYVCLDQGLSSLKMPHAKEIKIQIDGKDYTMIAEEALDINPDESVQEELYYIHRNRLEKVLRELAVFIKHTGFSDVSWRNIPLLNTSLSPQDSPQIALIDVEFMTSVEEGLTGGSMQGLIESAPSKEILDVLCEESKKLPHSLLTPSYLQRIEKKKAERREKLATDEALREFYKAKKISTGKETLQVDVQSLGLPLDVEGTYEDPMSGAKKKVTMQEVATLVINRINEQLSKASDKASLKGKRRIVVEAYRPHLLATFAQLQHKDKSWIRSIIEALIDKGHLFKLYETFGGSVYNVQA